MSPSSQHFSPGLLHAREPFRGLVKREPNCGDSAPLALLPRVNQQPDTIGLNFIHPDSPEYIDIALLPTQFNTASGKPSPHGTR